MENFYSLSSKIWKSSLSIGKVKHVCTHKFFRRPCLCSICHFFLLYPDVRDLFRNWREENCRQSEDVVDLWKEVLANHFGKLGDEGWLVLEQVFIAALDCHSMEIANFCLSKLNQEFPDSMRVKRLKAMKYEALERYKCLQNVKISSLSQEFFH